MLFSYEAVSENSKSILTIYIIFGLIGIMLISIMGRNYIKTRTYIAKLSFITFSLFSLVPIVLFIGFLESYITGYERELYRASLMLSYVFFSLHNYYYTRLIHDIYEVPRVKWNWDANIWFIITILVALPNNYYGIPLDEQYLGPDIRLMTTGIFCLMGIIMMLRFVRYSNRVEKKIQVHVFKKTVQWIGHCGVFMILFFIFLFVDIYSFVYLGTGGYTVALFFAFSFLMIYIIILVIGLFYPNLFGKGQYNLFLGNIKIQEIVFEKEEQLLELKTHDVMVVCPICNKKKIQKFGPDIELQIQAKKKPITSILIPENTVCEHKFMLYLDPNFEVRGYGQIDFVPTRGRPLSLRKSNSNDDE